MRSNGNPESGLPPHRSSIVDPAQGDKSHRGTKTGRMGMCATHYLYPAVSPKAHHQQTPYLGNKSTSNCLLCPRESHNIPPKWGGVTGLPSLHLSVLWVSIYCNEVITFNLFKSVGRMTPFLCRENVFPRRTAGTCDKQADVQAYTPPSSTQAKNPCKVRIVGDILNSSGEKQMNNPRFDFGVIVVSTLTSNVCHQGFSQIYRLW